MYSSAYSSSPIRTIPSGTGSSTYQNQLPERQYNQASSTIHYNSQQLMNDDNLVSRRMPPSTYSNSSAPSIPARNFSETRKYSSNINNSTNAGVSNRYPSTSYSSSYRSYGDNDIQRGTTARLDGNHANERTLSYDDLLSGQNRTQSSPYNSNTAIGSTNRLSYGQQQQQVRREPNKDYDDDLIVKSTDLSAANEQEMLDLVRSSFRKYDLSNQRELAGFLKRSADKAFSSCWHCIVGRQFSSYVTHEMNGFIYLTKGPLSILLFKSGS